MRILSTVDIVLAKTLEQLRFQHFLECYKRNSKKEESIRSGCKVRESFTLVAGWQRGQKLALESVT